MRRYKELSHFDVSAIDYKSAMRFSEEYATKHPLYDTVDGGIVFEDELHQIMWLTWQDAILYAKQDK